MSINSAMLAGVSGQHGRLQALDRQLLHPGHLGEQEPILQRRRREGPDAPVHQPAGSDSVDDLEPGPVDLGRGLLRHHGKAGKGGGRI